MPLTYPSNPLEGRDPAGWNPSANFTKASAQLTPRTYPTNQQEPCVGLPTRPSSPPAWATMPAFAVTPSTQAPHLEPLLTVENLELTGPALELSDSHPVPGTLHRLGRIPASAQEAQVAPHGPAQVWGGGGGRVLG